MTRNATPKDSFVEDVDAHQKIFHTRKKWVIHRKKNLQTRYNKVTTNY